MPNMYSFVIFSTAVLACTGCDNLSQAMTDHQDVVARAAGHELTIDETAGLLALNPQLPAQPEVVEAVSNLWVDYIALATAASEDTTLADLDLEPLLRPRFEQDLVFQLRDSVIQADTTLTEEELRSLYAERQPGAEVRARHILLQIPPDATPERRDSIESLAVELRDRARAGADFAALAEEYSDDPGSANQGGDLGFFRRGQMVPPFEEAAFALDPGQVSDVVESPFGLHVIKIEERRAQNFEEVRDEFETQIKNERLSQAQESYINELTGPLDLQVQADAYDVARELAREPGDRLNRRARSRPLVTFEGGAFTAGEYQEIMRFFPRNQRARLGSANDEQIGTTLERFARNEILIEEARQQGFEISQAQRDSLERTARQQLRQAARTGGLTDVEPQEDETRTEAVERKVKNLIGGIIQGRRDMLALGAVAFQLRDRYDIEIFERTFRDVVEQVEQARAGEAGGQPGATPGGVQPTQPPGGQPTQPPAGQPPAPQPADTTGSN